MRIRKFAQAGLFTAWILLIVAFTYFVPTDAYAENYKIPGQGDLHLDVPDGWSYKLDSSEKSLPPTIITAAKNADEFKVMITPLWRTDGNPLGLNKEKLKDLTEKESAKVLTQAVEDHADIQEIKGKDAYGYCYGVTDKSLVGKNPEPGDYQYMVRCNVVVGEVFLSATMLCQDKDNPLIQKAKAMLENARQLK